MPQWRLRVRTPFVPLEMAVVVFQTTAEAPIAKVGPGLLGWDERLEPMPVLEELVMPKMPKMPKMAGAELGIWIAGDQEKRPIVRR